MDQIIMDLARVRFSEKERKFEKEHLKSSLKMLRSP